MVLLLSSFEDVVLSLSHSPVDARRNGCIQAIEGANQRHAGPLYEPQGELLATLPAPAYTVQLLLLLLAAGAIIGFSVAICTQGWNPSKACLKAVEGLRLLSRGCERDGQYTTQPVGMFAALQLPQHIAIIMDGNRRYGKAKYGNPLKGHADGGTALSNCITWCQELGIKYLTVYAFSTENWGRSEAEISTLMKLFIDYFDNIISGSRENNVKIQCLSSDPSRLPADVQRKMDEMVDFSKDCDGLVLNLCISYGSRGEIAKACKEIAQLCVDGKVDVNSIDETLLRQHLLTSEAPDPDLVIRTSGEHRLSNFLLYQLAYAEFFFIEKNWPEMQRQDLLHILEQFNVRKRRFGK